MAAGQQEAYSDRARRGAVAAHGGNSGCVGKCLSYPTLHGIRAKAGRSKPGLIISSIVRIPRSDVQTAFKEELDRGFQP